MARVLGDDFKELVRTQSDIVAIISQTVALQPRRGGREFVGLCPFHDDHTPSFTVSPERQTYRCWACGAGGDVYGFVMNYDRLNFREALEMLAQRANVPIPQTWRRDAGSAEESKDNKNRWYEMLAWAEQVCHECLLTSNEARHAREYFRSRHLAPGTIEKFKLGYHPADWNWLINQARGKYSPDELATVRLAGQRSSGEGFRDEALFIDRVIFPIRDNRARTVAFGGRVIPGSSTEFGGKYMNSSESPLFSKSRLVYAFDHARDAIGKAGTVVVMEGYMDCIMAHQSGITNVVATLGTALTEHHVSFLKRFSRKVVLVFDGDEAGQNATERSLPRFLAQQIDLRVLTLPGDQDPADFLEGNSPEAFTALVDRAAEAWDFKLSGLIRRHGVASIDARHQVCEEMLETICQVPVASSTGQLGGEWQLRESIILGRLSQRLGISEPTLRQRLVELRGAQTSARTRENLSTGVNSGGTDRAARATGPLFPEKPTNQWKMEREALELILLCPESCADMRSEISPTEITNPDLRALLEVCLETAADGPWPGFEQVLTAVDDLRLKQLLVALESHGREVNIRKELVPHCLEHFRYQRHMAGLVNATNRVAGEDGSVPGSGTGANGTAVATSEERQRLQLAIEQNQSRMARRMQQPRPT